MMLLKSLVSLCILAVTYAVPAQEKRVHHHADLSDHIHNDAQGFQYDHEAFLGKEEAKTFDQLTPEESKAKLAYVLLALYFVALSVLKCYSSFDFLGILVGQILGFCFKKQKGSSLYNLDICNFSHRKIVERIDTNKDGYVSHAELHYWIKHRQRRYIEENVNKHWKDYDKNQDDKIGWEEYKNTTYGYYLGNFLKDVPVC